MSQNKLSRNVFVVRYRTDKCKKSFVFGTYKRLDFALHTIPIVMAWYDADVFDLYYIDSEGTSVLVFYWDRTKHVIK